MQVITDVAELVRKVDECNRVLTEQSDDAMRQLFNSFRMDFSEQLPRDPFSAAYAALQMKLYEIISGRSYSLDNERTPIDTESSTRSPFPYYLKSTRTAGHHLLAIAFLLCKLELPVGARVVEFGAGWGNTTIELARSGLDMTAVDVEPRFCEVIAARARQLGQQVKTVGADFLWAETVPEPFDGAIFFESFHHCADHLRLLRALHRAVKPEGRVYIASEPIFSAYPVPWGVRMDGEALWAMRNFGWLELGFDEAYFREALARTGWVGTWHICKDVHWASVWELRRSDATTPLPPGQFPPIRGAAGRWDGLPAEQPIMPTPDPEPDDTADRLRLELDSVYRSTSWRLTAPLRAAKRGIGALTGGRS